jgi:hypothetical protein
VPFIRGVIRFKGNQIEVKFLKVNIRFRIFLFAIGLVSLGYGVIDLNSQEAVRTGLNANKEESPFSYLFTVTKKLILGGLLVGIALSPLVGKQETED